MLVYCYAQVKLFKEILAQTGNLDSVYTGPDPFGTGTKLLRISLEFTQDLVDLVRIGFASGTKWVHLWR